MHQEVQISTKRLRQYSLLLYKPFRVFGFNIGYMAKPVMI